MQFRQLAALALVAVTAVGCEVHSTTGPGAVVALAVTPNSTLSINATQQFTAIATDAEGAAVPVVATWSIVAGGGTISPSGLFTAGTTPGTYNATVQATAAGRTATANVTVVAGALATIRISPTPRTLAIGATQQYTAQGRDAGNNIVPITPAVTWSVTASGGTISPTGLFTAGGAAGTFTNTVRATSGTMFGTGTVIVSAAPPPAPFVPLGAAEPNGIMAGTQVTCVTGGTVNADISISPGSTLTGFGPCQFTGVLNLATAIAATAQNDLTTAYNTLAGLPCPPANAIVANLGGTTLAAGVYCTASGISVSGTLTLDGGGDPNAVFVFQAGTSLTTAGNIALINGAQAQNVYWQVGSSATIGTASVWRGNILALTSITLVDNATLQGRALARNGAVSLGTNNTITLP